MGGLSRWLVTGAWLLASCAPGLAGRTVEVDRIDADVATVIDRATGEVEDIPRRQLPQDAREGHVVVDGRVDPALTAQLRAQVQDARAALRRVAPRPGRPAALEEVDEDGEADRPARPAGR